MVSGEPNILRFYYFCIIWAGVFFQTIYLKTNFEDCVWKHFIGRGQDSWKNIFWCRNLWNTIQMWFLCICMVHSVNALFIFSLVYKNIELFSITKSSKNSQLEWIPSQYHKMTPMYPIWMVLEPKSYALGLLSLKYTSDFLIEWYRTSLS